MINIRGDIKVIEKRKTIKKINKSKNASSLIKINKPLARKIRKKEQKIINIRNERVVVTTVSMDLKG